GGGLVDALVVADACDEVARRLVGVPSRVVGAEELRVADVALDPLRVLADDLDEHDADAGGLDPGADPRPAGARPVRGVEDRNVAALLHPADEVRDRLL